MLDCVVDANLLNLLLAYLRNTFSITQSLSRLIDFNIASFFMHSLIIVTFRRLLSDLGQTVAEDAMAAIIHLHFLNLGKIH